MLRGWSRMSIQSLVRPASAGIEERNVDVDLTWPLFCPRVHRHGNIKMEEVEEIEGSKSLIGNFLAVAGHSATCCQSQPEKLRRRVILSGRRQD